MTTKVLGKEVKSYSKGSFKTLDPIDRGDRPDQNGVDYWNGYEFTFLDKNKNPTLKVLEIQIPATSKFTVESKSLKIYLDLQNLMLRRSLFLNSVTLLILSY